MKLSGKHIHPFFAICIVLMGFILYSVNPMNAHSNKHSRGASLQIHSEALSNSEITENETLPDDEKSDISNTGYELTLKETENKEEPTGGDRSHATLKQAESHTISFVEIPPSDVLTLFKHQKILPNKDGRLQKNGPLFSHNFNFSPHTSGIAINAP